MSINYSLIRKSYTGLTFPPKIIYTRCAFPKKKELIIYTNILYPDVFKKKI